MASALHRYWAATFPEDYEENNLPLEWMERYKGEIPFCMKQLDRMLVSIIQFIKKNQEYKLIIASSMGQAATTATLIDQELFLADQQKFVVRLGFQEFQTLSAMHPQYNLMIDANDADAFEKKLKVISINGEGLSYRRKGATFFSLDFGYPNTKHFEISMDDEKVDLAELGLEIRKIDDQSGGTAYHIPEGVFYIL